jgi:iron complex outermembrane receptor protein
MRMSASALPDVSPAGVSMRTSLKPNLKYSLLVGTSLAAFAWSAGSALAQSQETVIVTGTRVQGMTAADSAAPITVLGTDALQHGVGTTDLRQALGDTVPSFAAQQFANDTAAFSLSAALRGLSPNDTLVLVNGKRRHYSANLHVDGGGFASGSSSADLSLIPVAAIDHVEVLLDGAAAQYGTDAIAGVVNIILKTKSSGGQLSATAGQYYSGTGETFDTSFNIGLPLFDKGFANITLEKQYHDFTHLGGADPRYINGFGQPAPEGTIGVGGNPTATNAAGIVPCSGGVCIPSTGPYATTASNSYPRTNRIDGDGEYQLTIATVNTGYDFSDNLHLYGLGTIAHRYGKTWQNVRLQNQVIASPGSDQACSTANPQGYNTAQTASGAPACAIGVSTTGSPSGAGVAILAGSSTFTPGVKSTGQIISSGQAGTLYTPGELVMYPHNMEPQEALAEDDYQYNLGTKFNVVGWDVDANIGYGKEIDKVYTLNSGNRSLFIDTHTTPQNFYDGSFTASQFIGTIDATHPFNIGMASPLTVAVGAEAREDTYFIGQGDAASYYKEGPQSFPGFAPASAGRHSRKNYAGYVDFALSPIEELQLDVAGRAEHFSDFGDTQIGKITARYDFNPQFAVRGTISTGFRAPTLAEEFYTAVNVSPTSATVQLPADSSAAQILGLGNLKAETSTQYSVGIVAHPLQDLAITVDAYSLTLGNRIVASSTVNSSGGAINTPLVTQAILADGVSLDPTATAQGVTAFLNGINSLTQGVDITVNYPTDFDGYGLIDWTFAANYNTNTVESIAPPPAILVASNPSASFFNFNSVFGFNHQTPTTKIGLTANWSLDEFGVTLRETYYGPQHSYTSPNSGGTYYPFNQAGVAITDLELRYNVTDALQFSFGGNNVFGLKPDAIPMAQSYCTGHGAVNITSACTIGPNSATGQGLTQSNGSVEFAPFGTVWNPNGGYYYARFVFNF